MANKNLLLALSVECARLLWADPHAISPAIGITQRSLKVPPLTALPPKISAISAQDASLKAFHTALHLPYRFFDIARHSFRGWQWDHQISQSQSLHLYSALGSNQIKQTPLTFEMKEFYSHVGLGFEFARASLDRLDRLGIGLDFTSLNSTSLIPLANSHIYGISLYYNGTFATHFSIDAIVKYAFSSSDLEASKAHLNTHLISWALAIAKKIPLDESADFLYIQPNLKLTNGVILPIDFEVSTPQQGTFQGKIQAQFPLIIRGSLDVGHEWNVGLLGDLKIGGFVEYSLKNGQQLQFNQGLSFNNAFKHDWDLGVSAWGSMQASRSWRFYFGLESSFIGSYANRLALRLGILWEFDSQPKILAKPSVPPPDRSERFNLRYRLMNTGRTLSSIKEEEITQMKHYDKRVFKSQQNRNKNRLSIENPPAEYQPQRGYNQGARRDRSSLGR